MRYWQQIKNIYHIVQALFWRTWYGRPDQGLTIYGITGTNGKTTTAYVLGHIMRTAYGKQAVGLLTTITFWVGEHEQDNTTKMTVLDSRLFFKYLRAMKRSGVTHVILETTSHALDQHRLAGIKLAGGIVLNVQREHLDYHQTMEQYARAKQKIINYLTKSAPFVGNEDDSYVREMLRYAKRRGITTHAFSIQTANVQTPLPGDFNKANVAAAATLSRAIGISNEVIQHGVDEVKQVPGRMEWIKINNKQALIDYAVTPQALENLYSYVRRITSGRIIAVLGGTGLRDRGKRPLMAQIVAKFADEIIFTREDPWTESEEQIFNDLEAGLKETSIPHRRILDRREAIRFAINKSGPNDVVVVTGKGVEPGMAVGHEIIPWSERAVIEEAISQAK